MSVTFKNTQLTILPLAISVALTGSQVLADEVKDKKKEVETIQVVGSATNTEITPDILEQIQAIDLEDIFRQTPSVTVGGGIAIAQKIYVRGLEDSILNVTVDGAPQTSTLFHHTGRLSIEPELLKQIDVQSGAGEATSGFGAIGGAIRFKTKSADDLLNGDDVLGGKLKASQFTNDGNKESLTLYGKLAEKVGVLASYVNVNSNDFEDGDGKKIEGTAADQSLAFFKINAEITDNQTLTVSHESRKLNGLFPTQTNWEPIETTELTQTWLNRDTSTVNYSFLYNELLNVEVTAYSTESELKREKFTWVGDIKTTGFDIRNTSDIGEHTITYGIERRKDRLLAQSYSNIFGGIYKEEGNVSAIYIQDHWQALDDLLISFGARKEKYDLDHDAQGANWSKIDGVWVAEPGDNASYSMPSQKGTSINAGLVYSITSDLNFNVGYAEALRGRQTTDSFIVGSLTGLNQNLKPEEVSNKEISLEYNDGTYIFELAAYSSQIDDVVFDKFKGDVIYENIGDLKSEGFEMVFGYKAEKFDVLISFNSNDIELNNAPFLKPDENSQTGFSTTVMNGVQLEAYEFGHLGNTIGDSINLAFNYQINENFDAGFNLNYVNSVKNIEVFHRSIELAWVQETDFVSKPSYHVFDVYAKYQITENFGVDFSVQNLFDAAYRSHGSVADYGHIDGYSAVVGFQEPGRDFRLTATLEF